METLKANVRIIAATNKNLEELVAAGIFRKDLYYRIKVIRLYIPPLRQRKEDIPLLVEHFINRFNHLQGKQIEGVSQEVLQILMHYSFPGNVRELENIIEHAFVLCNDAIIQGSICHWTCLNSVAKRPSRNISKNYRTWKPNSFCAL